MSDLAIGQSLPRVDGYDKVIGRADFPADLTLPGMAHMKALFAGRPHARILKIDTSRAEGVPGVLAVLTAEDVPVNSFGIDVADQPVLCGDIVRFVGDRVALVVAETEELAALGRDLIVVDYQDLAVVDGPDGALAPGAPVIHSAQPDNILASYRVRKGDVAAGFSQSDVIIEETYSLGPQEHAYLQPDAGLAWIDEEGRVVVKSAGQWAHDDRRQIARSLALPEEQVVVQYAAIGGAFGGREDLTVQIPLALAAIRLGRPVKMTWDRQETTIGHPKRHPMRIRHKWGAARDGRVLAQETEIVADAGAYASTSDYVLATTVLLSTGPYEVGNVSIDARAVFSNRLVGGAFRGFGAPQATFAAEAQMARLAEALEIDPVELRLRNFLREDSLTGTMSPVPPGLRAQETLEAGARSIGWQQFEDTWRRPSITREVRPGVYRGRGVAAGWKTVGYTLGWQDVATATIELHGPAEIDRVILRLPAAELGQGAHTVCRQMTAAALKLPVELIEMAPLDTSSDPSAGPASASRLVLMAGNAIRGAAQRALTAWQNEDRPAAGSYTYHAPPTEALDPETGHGAGAFAIAYLAQAVEIEIDVETGQVFVQHLVSAHDVGKAINPQLVEGQIEGGAIQGLGWSTAENFVTHNGFVLTPNLSTYLIPTVADIPPKFESIILEEELALGPWGATGVGEMSLLAVAPAILDAIHDATGVWCNQVPLTPENVLWSLKGRDPQQHKGL